MRKDTSQEISIGSIVTEAERQLLRAGISEPRLEASSLLAFVLKRDRTFLLTHREAMLSAAEVSSYREYVARRARREPLQYITNRQNFYNHEFVVTPAVLIPRPESELLVETALDLLRDEKAPRILDVGTGSGCIIISLLHALPGSRGVGVDISIAALKISDLNATRIGVRERLMLIGSDSLTGLSDHERRARFSIIVSNPPYIDAAAIGELQPEVRLYEPLTSLTPGPDGLEMIQRLTRQATRYLVNGGHLVFEIGYDQGAKIETLIDPNAWDLVAIQRDLQGIQRTVVLKLKSL